MVEPSARDRDNILSFSHPDLPALFFPLCVPRRDSLQRISGSLHIARYRSETRNASSHPANERTSLTRRHIFQAIVVVRLIMTRPIILPKMIKRATPMVHTSYAERMEISVIFIFPSLKFNT